MSVTADELQAAVAKFVRERDWEQFHDVKNLSMAMCSEAGELAGILRWKSTSDAALLEVDAKQRDRIAAELGDVGIIALAMCNRLGLSFSEVVSTKLRVNAENYPADGTRGVADRDR